MPDFRNLADLPAPVFPGSHLVIDEPYVYISGLVAIDIDPDFHRHGNVTAETEIVLRGLDHILASAGSDLAHVLRVDVHLADLNEIEALDAVYATFFDRGRYPARTCTKSPHLCGDCRIEITVIARQR